MKNTAGGPKHARRSGSRAYSLPLLGWRECVSLPDLGLKDLEAKIDTGARTSSLHVSSVDTFKDARGVVWLRLTIPERRDGRIRRRRLELPSKGVRRVRSSSGHSEFRHSLHTRIRIGDATWTIDVTLSDRSEMRYPMLIGRAAIRGRYLVHAGRSYLQSKPASRVTAGRE